FGDERSEKRQLVSELLEVIDAKSIARTSFENLAGSLRGMHEESGAGEIPEEYRGQWEEAQRREAERLREFQERMFARIDFVKYHEETYVPLLESQFNADELRQLIDFFKSRHGQKLAKILPRFSMAEGMQTIREAAEATDEELRKEEAARYPWKQVMSDLRSLAIAVEARATDTNEYPAVAFEELEALIAPTYIREVPKSDFWGTPYLYVGDGQHYRFVSAGADKRFEWSSRQLDLTLTEPRFSKSLDTDIIFQDGIFVQSPEAEREP
ncbi:MAG TPA: DUF2059 domain-containing protein, partial [Thermoanaerobaculia bacterium]